MTSSFHQPKPSTDPEICLNSKELFSFVRNPTPASLTAAVELIQLLGLRAFDTAANYDRATTTTTTTTSGGASGGASGGRPPLLFDFLRVIDTEFGYYNASGFGSEQKTNPNRSAAKPSAPPPRAAAAAPITPDTKHASSAADRDYSLAAVVHRASVDVYRPPDHSLIQSGRIVIPSDEKSWSSLDAEYSVLSSVFEVLMKTGSAPYLFSFNPWEKRYVWDKLIRADDSTLIRVILCYPALDTVGASDLRWSNQRLFPITGANVFDSEWMQGLIFDAISERSERLVLALLDRCTRLDRVFVRNPNASGGYMTRFSGETFLMHACRFRRASVIRLLLSRAPRFDLNFGFASLESKLIARLELDANFGFSDGSVHVPLSNSSAHIAGLIAFKSREPRVPESQWSVVTRKREDLLLRLEIRYEVAYLDARVFRTFMGLITAPQSGVLCHIPKVLIELIVSYYYIPSYRDVTADIEREARDDMRKVNAALAFVHQLEMAQTLSLQ